MGTPALLARGPDAGGSSVQRPEEMMLFQASLVEGARDDHSIGAECAGMMFFAVPAMLHALLFASVYPLARCFSQILVRWLGNISYSYYLIHGGALHVFSPSGRCNVFLRAEVRYMVLAAAADLGGCHGGSHDTALSSGRKTLFAEATARKDRRIDQDNLLTLDQDIVVPRAALGVASDATRQ